jgi:hypothetical protein
VPPNQDVGILDFSLKMLGVLDSGYPGFCWVSWILLDFASNFLDFLDFLDFDRNMKYFVISQ